MNPAAPVTRKRAGMAKQHCPAVLSHSLRDDISTMAATSGACPHSRVHHDASNDVKEREARKFAFAHRLATSQTPVLMRCLDSEG